MRYHSNLLLGAPISKAGQEAAKAAALEHFKGDHLAAAAFMDKVADRQMSKASGLLSASSLLAGLSYFVHARIPLFLIIVALLLCLTSFYSKWPGNQATLNDPALNFEHSYHIAANRSIANSVTTFLLLIAVILLVPGLWA